MQTTMSGRKALMALAVAVVLMRSHSDVQCAELERRIVCVVTPADQPGHGFDQGEVPVVVQGAVDLVSRLEDVQPLHRIHFGGGAEARLEDTGCDVVARADAGCEDQYASTHDQMLGHAAPAGPPEGLAMRT